MSKNVILTLQLPFGNKYLEYKHWYMYHIYETKIKYDNLNEI